ncbi:MAG: adenylate cyclase [Firmicutes bacterium HGW-Firmicutes-1]|jgi:CYTH domain-containing protein|nr:MAG: adenylate cyclase [Firmicutes bacterium HGW-Firmicutes-1]
MEIEKKFLVKDIPFDLDKLKCDAISQGYICTSPVIRIRQKGANFYLTCKSKGLMARDEFEIEISDDEFLLLSKKVDYNLITKIRYYIPLTDSLTIELDIFKGVLNGLILAEVEFPSLEAAYAFIPPTWFGKETTNDTRFHNNYLCQLDDLSGYDI